jgi:DNA-binding transcriptional MocR family regulator
MELAAGIDATAMLIDAIDSGVAYVPGQPFFVDGSGANTLRLAYSKESTQAISDGVERMCRVFKSAKAQAKA